MGRNKISDKKERVVFYMEQSKIKLNGGMQNVRFECYNHLSGLALRKQFTKINNRHAKRIANV